MNCSISVSIRHKDHLEAFRRLIAEEVLYLSESKWTPIVFPSSEYAFILWKDPSTKNLFEQTNAVAIQKGRDTSEEAVIAKERKNGKKNKEEL